MSSKAVLSRLEKGQNLHPTLEDIAALAAFYGVTVDYLAAKAGLVEDAAATADPELGARLSEISRLSWKLDEEERRELEAGLAGVLAAVLRMNMRRMQAERAAAARAAIPAPGEVPQRRPIRWNRRGPRAATAGI